MTPHAALAAYNATMGPAGARYPVRPTAENLTMAAEVAQMCADRGWDLGRYLRARLDAVGGRFRPTLRQLRAPSAAFVAEFERWGENRQAWPEGQARLMAACVDEPPREGAALVPHAEALKRIYATFGDAELCRLAAAELTLGYNPASETCRRCVQAEGCAGDLSPAVRAVRGIGIGPCAPIMAPATRDRPEAATPLAAQGAVSRGGASGGLRG